MDSKIDLPNSRELAQRKGQHIELAKSSQTAVSTVDTRFYYEPLFFNHQLPKTWPVTFLGAALDFPLWISSMTGGTELAETINKNLSRLVGQYKLGMGLGSCRPLLESDDRLKDFNWRKNLGNQPFFANLGIAQVEELLDAGKISLVKEMVKKLEANGIIIHINPLQEWFQPEGDRFLKSPLETLQRFLEVFDYPVLVKEVGQGMGPRSLKALLDLPIAGIEFGAFGGTNFSLLENLRSKSESHKEEFIHVGHTAREMIEFMNALGDHQKEIIVSGGIKSSLDAYELLKLSKSRSLVGMAYAFLEPASQSYEALERFYLSLRDSMLTACGILELRGE